MSGPNKCIGCGLEHPSVEAVGFWHCPNILCFASGATNPKRDAGLVSKDGTVVPSEMVAFGEKWIANQTDDAIADAARRSLERWRKLATEDVGQPELMPLARVAEELGFLSECCPESTGKRLRELEKIVDAYARKEAPDT